MARSKNLISDKSPVGGDEQVQLDLRAQVLSGFSVFTALSSSARSWTLHNVNAPKNVDRRYSRNRRSASSSIQAGERCYPCLRHHQQDQLSFQEGHSAARNGSM